MSEHDIKLVLDRIEGVGDDVRTLTKMVNDLRVVVDTSIPLIRDRQDRAEISIREIQSKLERCQEGRGGRELRLAALEKEALDKNPREEERHKGALNNVLFKLLLALGTFLVGMLQWIQSTGIKPRP